MGMLIERRKDLRGRNQIESGMRWAKLTFGRILEDEKTMFVIPSELKLDIRSKWIIGKGIFTKEEMMGMARLVDQELKTRS